MSDLLNILSMSRGKISEEELAKMMGGKIVTCGGKKFMSFPSPPSGPNTSFGEIVFSSKKSGIVGIVSKNLKRQYFIGVPKGHLWFNGKISFFNSMKDPISIYGGVTYTDLDSLEKDGRIMRSIAIEMTIESLVDKRERYWIGWDYDTPDKSGVPDLLKEEVKRIGEMSDKL